MRINHLQQLVSNSGSPSKSTPTAKPAKPPTTA